MNRILVIGANGQIGSVLTNTLRNNLGIRNVIASDIQYPKKGKLGIFENLNILDKARLIEVVKKYKITQIYHLAAILSAKGEANPLKAWKINMTGFFNVLEVAREFQIEKVFFPSSIAVFGQDAPSKNTPQNTFLNPTTVYGISKSAGENWCQYYHEKYGLDIRSLRYPGVIGHQSMPGGGTTDYAVDIYHKAVLGENYECFLAENTALPMIYMEDVIRATLGVMEAPIENIKTRTSYNLAGMSFSPIEVATEIQKYFPTFKVNYKPDFRQQIAESWPQSIDDSLARKDWGWQPKFDLEKMTSDMIMNLKEKYESPQKEMVV